MEIDPNQLERQQFVEGVGLFFENFGVPRTVGRILGWLLICQPEVQSSADLAEALNTSPGSISTGTRTLIHMGMIERVSQPGDRRTWYRLVDGAMVHAMKAEIEGVLVFRRLADRGLALMRDETPEARARLESARDFYAFLEDELMSVLERWEALQRWGDRQDAQEEQP